MRERFCPAIVNFGFASHSMERFEYISELRLARMK
jgi:hypothetical protein